LIKIFQDAHNAILDYGVNSSLFAVYDGHGGSEVAKYCALHLPEFIKENSVYISGDYEKVCSLLNLNSFKNGESQLLTLRILLEVLVK
jgi:serine/threonine protein phosphatase PrpC